MVAAHDAWFAQYSPGVADDYDDSSISPVNPSIYATLFQDELNGGTASFLDACFGTASSGDTGRLGEIEDRLGTPVSVTGYVKDLYTDANLMAGKNVGTVRKVYSDLFSLPAFYDRITALRTRYRAYEQASPN